MPVTGPGDGGTEPAAAAASTATAVRTAIMTVDDDPGVSRAVARDLRRRYGESHRIVRAESAEAALAALSELKLRGDLVAVILADYRMPQMNGIEFLERAMDVYPGARRVLLTAYADTGAAIDAINVVDLDHYLLKPWDPPEEKLYPVVDALLETRGWPPITGRSRRLRSSGTAGRRARPRSVSSWPATRCRTGGMPPTSRKASGCSRRPARTGWPCRS